MKIIAHRGLWRTESEKNTLKSFERAFESWFGIETDIRDLNGKIVISHNPADKNSPTFEELLEMWNEYGKPQLALNIKADGLYLLAERLFKKYELNNSNYFLFDSSVPEQYIYIKRGYNVFTRSSEFEKETIFWNKSNGVWLDQFTDCNHIMDSFEKLINSGKIVSVVSPELHKRDNFKIWKFLYDYKEYDNFFLCTDEPDKAKEFFKWKLKL